MAGWNKLPAGLRWMIVAYIREFSQSWKSVNPPNPQLPLVCREWRAYFSHDNFEILVLDQKRLKDFGQLVHCNLTRRYYVCNIILRVKLPEYDCTVCQKREDAETARQNDMIFISTLQKLFSLLSTWQDSKQGIRLDIGAYSPSDGQYGFRDARFSSGYTCGARRKVYERHHITKTNREDSVTCPGWQRALEGKQALMPAKRRLLATLGILAAPHFDNLSVDNRIQFTAAPIVRQLIIRRHYYRHISKDFLGEILRQALPNLVVFRSETWVHPDDHSQGYFQHEHTAILAALPNTVQDVHLFYHSSPHLRPSTANPVRFSAWRRDLSRDVANAATSLKTMSTSFLVDASDFIAYSNSAALHFPNLKYLILTSKTLRKREALTSVIRHLLSAGNLALQGMPQLEFLEIWNEDKTRNETFNVRFICNTESVVRVLWTCPWLDEQDLNPLSIQQLGHKTPFLLSGQDTKSGQDYE